MTRNWKLAWLTLTSFALLQSLGCADNTADRTAATATDAPVLAVDVEPIREVSAARPGVFIPPFKDCRAPLPGEVGTEADGKVCTHVSISGCTEGGKYFPDYASCDVVRTQRPFWPEAPAAQPDPADPRLNDAAFMRELAFATEQVEACACTCCHDARQNQGQTGQWDIRNGPIWLDTLSDSGLALFAGYADSSSLGAYPSADNHGFDRKRTGIPSNDSERMLAFLRAELTRRGISEADARSVPPFGGPIYANRVKKPDLCSELGHGVDAKLQVQFGAGQARYVYVLADASENPGVPPDLDTPQGTLWRLDVLASQPALASGLMYGSTPAGSFQVVPERGSAPALERGKRYQLVVLRDVGLPVTSCLFTFGAKVASAAAAPAADGGKDEDYARAGNAATAPTNPPLTADDSCTLAGGDAAGFGARCSGDQDCSCKANYCALMPGQSQGTCTVQGCKAEPGLCPSGYGCFDLSIFAPGLPSICTKS
jgi:hypothetical protein